MTAEADWRRIRAIDGRVRGLNQALQSNEQVNRELRAARDQYLAERESLMQRLGEEAT